MLLISCSSLTPPPHTHPAIAGRLNMRPLALRIDYPAHAVHDHGHALTSYHIKNHNHKSQILRDLVQRVAELQAELGDSRRNARRFDGLEARIDKIERELRAKIDGVSISGYFFCEVLTSLFQGSQ